MTLRYIYHLVDEAGTVRYVGQSNNPYRRLLDHLSAMWREPWAVYGWLRELARAGRVPDVRIVTIAAPWMADAAERFEIRRQRIAGAPLLNEVHGEGARLSPKRRAQAMREKSDAAREEFREFLSGKSKLHPAQRAVLAGRVRRLKCSLPIAPELVAKLMEVGAASTAVETNLSRLVDTAIAEYVAPRWKPEMRKPGRPKRR